jgi:acyl dehydratase
MHVRSRRGWYASDLVVGDVFEHRPGRTVYTSDNLLYCGLTLNTNSLHVNAHEAVNTDFGRPLMNALFVLSCVIGLSVSEIGEGTAIANLALDKVLFSKPVFDGDTLYSSTRVIDVRSSKSRPGVAVVEFEHIGTNQHGVTVCSARRVGLMRMTAPDRNRDSRDALA